MHWRHKIRWKYLDILREVRRFFADTIGQWMFWTIYKLPYCKVGLKIMYWVIKYETLDPYENK